ncbi:hypothetical protein PRIC2_011512 [Phytophthora ramorum]
MGRRGVLQLSPAQWRDALDQQIREKEQQQRRSESEEGDAPLGAPQRRSQSAPQQEEGDAQPIRSVPEFERAATCNEGDDDSQMVRGRRRFQQLQSKDEYLKGLQDQIEEKKRLAQEQLEMERSRRWRGSRSEEEDAGGRGYRWGEEHGAHSNTREESVAGIELHDRLDDVKLTAVSNQHEVDPRQAPVLKNEVAVDPEAISKIAIFCEELKKQNEDVKRQLLEQHAVLASLHSTLATDADRKGPVDGSQRRNSALPGSVELDGKLQASNMPEASSMKKAQAKGFEVKSVAALKTAPRPRPARGETKIPLPSKRPPFSLRSAGINIVKGLIPESATQPISPLKRAEAKLGPGERRDSTRTEKSAIPLESSREGLAEEEIMKSSQVKANHSESGDASEFQDPFPESEAKREVSPTSSEKEIRSKSSGDLNEARVRVNTQEECNGVGDERPMDAESKLVHNWETGSELLNCTSISILDGPSSLIPLDRSVAQLF